MEGIIPGQPWIVGASAPAPADALLPGTATLSWADGPRRWEGVGVAAELTGSDGGSLLEAVARSRVELEATSGLSAPGLWFGGFAFDASARVDGWWEGFPAARAVVPALLLASDGTAGQLSAFEPVGEDGADAARGRARTALGQALRLLRAPGSSPAPAAVSLRPQDRGAWDRLVAEALAAFADGQLRKVVLARALDVLAGSPFDLEGVMERIRALAGPAVVYRLLGRDGTSLVGASPEHLFVLHDGLLETQALASTAAPEDVERLGGRKEAREHAVVVESIRLALAPLSQHIEIGAAPEPLTLGYVAHLRTPVQAQLHPGVRPADVVRALHPTAAVGGTPRAQALDFLRRHERLARGWYAGAIGWMGAESVDLRVALRCALVRGATARLFSGAGAVTGSTADGEWHETALKARFMLRALGAEG